MSDDKWDSEIRTLRAVADGLRNPHGCGLTAHRIACLGNYLESVASRLQAEHVKRAASLLELCPFCGGEARFCSTYDAASGWGDKNRGHVSCTHCGIRTPDEGWNDKGLSKDVAIGLWNCRDLQKSRRDKQQRYIDWQSRASIDSAAL